MRSIFAALLFLWGTSHYVPAGAQEIFIVEEIKVAGLQRISDGTVFNYLPIKVGESVDAKRITEALRALYRTGFFVDVELYRDGNTLWLKVAERPSISAIEISGNEEITTDQLKDSLKELGLAEGRVFNPSLLDRVEQELRRQYFAQGKYAVEIESDIVEQEFNRVSINIQVNEGEVATIEQINIVGNVAFTDDELLDQFQLQSSEDEGSLGSDDQYSKNKLAADLEALRSYYMDRGYINFRVDSTQVSITPDRRQVFVTINIHEGDQYRVAAVKLAGNLVVAESELRGLISLQLGTVFSRKEVSHSSGLIGERLGEEGYAFANINPVPELNDEQREVTLTFYIDPGKRVYIRRINMVGNSKTRDEVLRREIRVMEGGWIDTKKVKLSHSRLERLGYFETVNVETPAVPGTTDQVDINYSVVEQPSGTLMASIGYSDEQGVVVSASVSQNNFLGTGNKMDFTINNSDVTDVYRVSYTNPYYTIDGVSRGFSLFRRDTDASEADLVNYQVDTSGGEVRYGIPLNESNRMSFSLGYETTHLVAGTTPSTSVQDFLNLHGDLFDTISLGIGWSFDTRNRAFFATEGTKISVSVDGALPGGDLEYYKVRYRHNWFTPLGDDYSLGLKLDLGYGDGYGDTTSLPFFKNFYAGGARTVRGYIGNSLGPRENNDPNGDPLGGNMLIVGRAELALPIFKETKTAQAVAFIDGGNVYNVEDGTYDPSELRYSYGMSASWMSPIGPLTFSYAFPFNDQPDDDTQTFQFSIGIPL